MTYPPCATSRRFAARRVYAIAATHAAALVNGNEGMLILANPSPAAEVPDAHTHRAASRYRTQRHLGIGARHRGAPRSAVPRPRRPTRQRLLLGAAGLLHRQGGRDRESGAAHGTRPLGLPQQSPRLARTPAGRVARGAGGGGR